MKRITKRKSNYNDLMEKLKKIKKKLSLKNDKNR